MSQDLREAVEKYGERISDKYPTERESAVFWVGFEIACDLLWPCVEALGLYREQELKEKPSEEWIWKPAAVEEIEKLRAKVGG